MYQGKKLKAARLAKRLSLQELSDLMDGLASKQMLQKYETGQSVPTEKTKYLLCFNLDISPEYLTNSPSVSLNQGMFRRYAGYQTTGDDLKAKFSKKIEAYTIIQDILQLHAPFSNPIEGYPISSMHDIESAVEIVRMRWGIGMGIVASAIDTMETRGVMCFDFTAESEINGFSGFADEDYQNPFTFINNNLNLSDDRKRFTVFHELGHILLYTSKLSEIEQEKFANQFAGAMLLPRRTLFAELGERKQNISFDDLSFLKRKYGISMYSALIRCKECNIIHISVFNELKAKLDIDKSREPVAYVGFESPSRFQRMLSRAINSQIFTPEEVMKYVLETDS